MFIIYDGIIIKEILLHVCVLPLHPELYMLKPDLRCDGIWKWDLRS